MTAVFLDGGDFGGPSDLPPGDDKWLTILVIIGLVVLVAAPILTYLVWGI